MQYRGERQRTLNQYILSIEHQPWGGSEGGLNVEHVLVVGWALLYNALATICEISRSIRYIDVFFLDLFGRAESSRSALRFLYCYVESGRKSWAFDLSMSATVETNERTNEKKGQRSKRKRNFPLCLRQCWPLPNTVLELHLQ